MCIFAHALLQKKDWLVWSTEDKLILAYKGDVTEPEAKKQLEAKLQDYMVPTEYHRMDHMLFNLNGKVDRKAIEKIFCSPQN